MAELIKDPYVAYLRGYAKARTKAIVAEKDFAHPQQIGDPILFQSVEQYAAFALGIEHGSNPQAEATSRKFFEAALKKMVES